jgi:hypothetical protein
LTRPRRRRSGTSTSSASCSSRGAEAGTPGAVEAARGATTGLRNSEHGCDQRRPHATRPAPRPRSGTVNLRRVCPRRDTSGGGNGADRAGSRQRPCAVGPLDAKQAQEANDNGCRSSSSIGQAYGRSAARASDNGRSSREDCMRACANSSTRRPSIAVRIARGSWPRRNRTKCSVESRKLTAQPVPPCQPLRARRSRLERVWPLGGETPWTRGDPVASKASRGWCWARPNRLDRRGGVSTRLDALRQRPHLGALTGTSLAVNHDGASSLPR